MRKHWDQVCSRKENAIIEKQKKMKEILNKKFAREKEFQKRMNSEVEGRLYDLEQRVERFNENKQRREQEEEKLRK